MEILVHISSPSTARDDARYRAQVAAILAFQPVSRQRLAADARDNLHAQPSGPENVQSSVAHHSAPSGRVAFPPHSDNDEPSFVPEQAQDPQLILRPSTDKTGSSPGLSQHYPDSLESLISVIPDSQPENGMPLSSLPPSCHLPSPKRRRVGDSGWWTNNQSRSTSTSISTSSSSSPNNSNKRREEKQPDKSPTTTSPLIPRSNSITQPRTHSNVPFHVSPPPTASNSRLNTFPFPFPSLPQETHPPLPPISTAPFTTHVTPTLSMLTERLNPDRTYKPLHQTRPLDKLERGYWAVHINVLGPLEPALPEAEPESQNLVQGELRRKPGLAPQQQQQHGRNWAAPVFARFWSFLSDFIGRDARAGWGVWCIVESVAENNDPTVPLPAMNDENAVVPISLKVYAWGEIAMHIYLLLYLASDRHIRGMGAQWRDSGEETVILMP